MRDLVLGAVGGYTWDKIEVWATSLARSGFKGIAALIVYDDNETVLANLKKMGIQALRMPLRGSVFNQRFYDFYEVIHNAASDLRYAIVTDVRDVYFQADPTVWLEENLTKQFVACSEGLTYKNEPWGKDNVERGFPALAPRMMDETIYNVGVLAGEARAIADLTLGISMWAKASGFPVADQSGYNIMLRSEPYASACQFTPSEAGFAVQAGTFADPNKIAAFRPHLLEPEPYMDSDGVKTSTGKLYPIVHQYERVPAWKPNVYMKLGL